VHLRSPGRRRRARLATAALLASVVFLGACSNDSPEPAATADTFPPTTAAKTGCDARVEDFPQHVAYAKERGELAVYANPGDAAPMQTFANPRQTDSNPPIDVPLVFLAVDEPTANDCEWVQVMLPVRPNGTKGWVKRADIKMEGHVYRIEVFLDEFKLKAYRGDEVFLDVPIGVAADNRPTPGGLYYTTELLASSDPAYGPYAFGLSGFSEVLQSFNGGQGQLGLHGTNQPERIGTKVSSGCIRMRNEDIEALVAEVESTTQGIPVQVYA
jgi:hypothetical protein